MGDETTAARVTPEFESVLRYLRTLAEPCAPPAGAGGFDVLYASAREVVVWYSPARDGQTAREVAIPADTLSAAWGALCDAGRLDGITLAEQGLGPAGIQWVLALLAQIPGVQVREEPLALAWPLLATAPPAPTPPDSHALGAEPLDPLEDAS